MELVPITLERLARMREVLSRSAGYAVSIDAELEYFNPNKAQGWFAGLDASGICSCFIRYFEQENAWSLGELFVSPGVRDRGAVAHALLTSFQSQIHFPKGHRLRFDLQRNDEELNKVLAENGYSERRQLFRHFVRPIKTQAARLSIPVLYPTENLLEHGREIAGVLSNLHPVSQGEAGQWVAKGTIRVVRAESAIAAAAQIFVLGSSIEVNRFATHPALLRQGYGEMLLQKIIKEATDREIPNVCLKVEDVRIPAIALYRKAGFREDEDKAQVWHSRWF